MLEHPPVVVVCTSGKRACRTSLGFAEFAVPDSLGKHDDIKSASRPRSEPGSGQLAGEGFSKRLRESQRVQAGPVTCTVCSDAGRVDLRATTPVSPSRCRGPALVLAS